MPANLKTVPGVNSGNSRETRVRNFINRMPGQAVRLVLSAEREDAGPIAVTNSCQREVHSTCNRGGSG